MNAVGSNTFIDQTGKTVVAHGGATQSATQAKWGASSAYFNGTDAYLSVANQYGLTLGSVFTVECWLYLTAYPAVGKVWYIFAKGTLTDPPTYSMYVDSAGKITCAFTSVSFTQSSALTLNTWHHVYFTNNYNTGMVGQDGTAGTNASGGQTVENLHDLTVGWVIGGTTDNYFQGYIDDFRITKGMYQYYAAPTIPSEQFRDYGPASAVDPYWSNVGTLLHLNGAVGAPTTTIGSKSPFYPWAWNSVGPVYNGSQWEFPATSAYFSAANSYLQIAPSNYGYGYADFTIEAWVYMTAYTVPGACIYYTNGGLSFILSSSGTQLNYGGVYAYTSTPVPLNAWHHVAVTRASTIMRIFLDGIMQSTSDTGVGAVNIGVATLFRIGAVNSTTDQFYGYMQEFRDTAGIARYTANFTPLRNRLPDPTPYTDPAFLANVLLMHMEGPDGLAYPAPTDVMGHSFQNMGGWSYYRATPHVFGLTSIQPTVNAYISFSAADLALGTGDFTIEGWFYTLAVAGGSTYVCYWAQTDAQLQLYGNTYVWWDGTTRQAASAAITAGAFHHVAVTRQSGVLMLFLDGIMSGSTPTVSTNITGTTPSWGATNGGGGFGTNGFNGYLDDCRVTAGYARYTSNFIPPTSAFPDH